MTLEWDPQAAPAVIALATTTVCYTAYRYLATPPVVRRVFGEPEGSDALRTAVAFWRRGLGVVLLGMIPLLVALSAFPTGLSSYGLTAHSAPLSLGLAAAMAAVVLALSAVSLRNPAMRDHYPEVRRLEWSGRTIALNTLSWVLYLVAYEFLFRGFLLFALAHAFGPWPAIAATTAIYVAVHLTANAAEAVGTIPGGVIFAVVALHTGSILMPLVAHILIACGSDLLAVRANPTMRYVGRRAPASGGR